MNFLGIPCPSEIRSPFSGPAPSASARAETCNALRPPVLAEMHPHQQPWPLSRFLSLQPAQITTNQWGPTNIPTNRSVVPTNCAYPERFTYPSSNNVPHRRILQTGG